MSCFITIIKEAHFAARLYSIDISSRLFTDKSSESGVFYFIFHLYPFSPSLQVIIRVSMESVITVERANLHVQRES